VPAAFAAANARGTTWLAARPGFTGRPAPYWRPFKPILRTGYGGRCGYAALYEPAGTVDHFTSIKTAMNGAYVWANYRFAAQWINSAKKPAGDGQWIDPEAIGADWFIVDLPDFQLKAGPGVPPAMLARVQYTLANLPIGSSEQIIGLRREWYAMFKARELELLGLDRVAPQVADAVRRFNRKRSKPDDCRDDLP
jgi:hypothetical protein